MFTQQAAASLAKLKGLVPDRLIEVLQDLLGNCAQELEHRGPVRFRGPVEFHQDVVFNAPPPGAAGWAKALFNWVNQPNNGSYVICQTCLNQHGAESAGARIIKVWLPRQSAIGGVRGQDPNVVAGAVIAYALDAQGEAVCVSDYLDDKIGTIKIFDGPDSEIPPGWELVHEIGGTSLMDPASSRGRVAASYLDPNWPEFEGGRPEYKVIGGSGGREKHRHDTHHFSTTLTAGPETVATTLVQVSGTIEPTRLTWSGKTECQTTGLTAAVLPPHRHQIPFTIVPVVPAMTGGVDVMRWIGSTMCTTTEWDNECSSLMQIRPVLIEPQCHLAGGDLSPSYGPYSYGHAHRINADLGYHTHTFVGDWHLHHVTIPQHQHPLSFSLEHNEEEHIDPFIVVKWIRRIDNSSSVP